MLNQEFLDLFLPMLFALLVFPSYSLVDLVQILVALYLVLYALVLILVLILILTSIKIVARIVVQRRMHIRSSILHQ